MLPNQNNKLSSDVIIRQIPKIEIEISTEEEQEEEMPTGEMPVIDKHMQGQHDQSSHSRSSRSNQYSKPYYDQESKKLKTAVSQAEDKIKDLEDKIKTAESDAKRFESVASEATRAIKNPKFLELPINERNKYREVRDKMTRSANSMRSKVTGYNYELDDAEAMLADAKAALDNFESQWDD